MFRGHDRDRRGGGGRGGDRDGGRDRRRDRSRSRSGGRRDRSRSGGRRDRSDSPPARKRRSPSSKFYAILFKIIYKFFIIYDIKAMRILLLKLNICICTFI